VDLSEVNERYEQLVEEEDNLIMQLEVCDRAQSLVLDMYFASSSPMCITEPSKEVVHATHAINLRLQTQLLEVRLEKKCFVHFRPSVHLLVEESSPRSHRGLPP
jgi:hypothetical protein